MAILFGRDQLPVVLAFLVCGALAGMVYDMLKIKRHIFGAPSVLLFIDDIFFSAVCTLLVVFCAFAFNDGNMKWYELPFFAGGFVIYRLTLSKLVIGIVFKLIDLVKKAIHFLLLPVKRLLRFIGYRTAQFLEQLALQQYTQRTAKNLYKIPW